MSSNPTLANNIRATVKTTAAIINLIIIIILDEIYAAIARWLTTLGKKSVEKYNVHENTKLIFVFDAGLIDILEFLSSLFI